MQEREFQDQPSRSRIESRAPPNDLVCRALWRRENRQEYRALRQQQEARRRRNNHLRQRAREVERIRAYIEACSMRDYMRQKQDELKVLRDHLHAGFSFWTEKREHCREIFQEAGRCRLKHQKGHEAKKVEPLTMRHLLIWVRLIKSWIQLSER